MMDFLSQNAGVIGLVFFFSFFCGLIVWVYRPGSRQKYEATSRIPLKDDGSHD